MNILVIIPVTLNWEFLQECHEKKIKNAHTSDVNFAPEIIGNYRFNSMVNVKGICFKQDSVSILYKNVVNFYISYEFDTWSKDLSTDFKIGNCLLGALKLTKNAGPDKYKYSSSCIGFDSCLQFSWSDGSNGNNVIIFGVDNSNSFHVDGRNKHILVLGEGLTQGLDKAIIITEAKYPINFAESGKRFVLSLRHTGSNSFFIC